MLYKSRFHKQSPYMHILYVSELDFCVRKLTQYASNTNSRVTGHIQRLNFRPDRKKIACSEMHAKKEVGSACSTCFAKFLHPDNARQTFARSQFPVFDVPL